MAMAREGHRFERSDSGPLSQSRSIWGYIRNTIYCVSLVAIVVLARSLLSPASHPRVFLSTCFIMIII